MSGEDDQPYRPVNVPSTKFPQFQIKVDVPRFKLGVHSRYMVAHRSAPAFAPAAAPLVDGGARKVAADPAPAIAPDAEVILFIHGMDSRVEEAEQLTDALHRRPDRKNWTVISFDLPTNGYGGFDWKPAAGLGGPPQAQCWFSDRWSCKQAALRAARLDRHETYDANFRAWHWRLAAEQLAFSQQQFADGTRQPLYLRNHKRMLLICGHEDTCGDLCKHTREVAAKMVNTPGYARFMQQTGHSLDNEYPTFIASEIATFLP